jgi:heme exporter protein B
MIRQAVALLLKELRIEWRHRTRFLSLAVFAVALLLLVAFTAPSIAHLRDLGAGGLWMSILLASTRSLDQTWSVELENNSLEGLILWPVDPRAIYFGKALANGVILLMVAMVAVPTMMLLFDVSVRGSPWMLAAILMAGCFAISGPGTILGLLTAQARGSSALLPLLLFPLVVPVLLAASRGTQVVLDGDPMGQGGSWLGLLLAFNAIHWSLSAVLFARVAEEP